MKNKLHLACVLKRLAATSVVIILTLLALAIPLLVSRVATGAISPFQNYLSILILAVLAISLTVARGIAFRVIFAIVIIVFEMAWIAPNFYFNSILTPAMLSLASEQLFEINNSIAGEMYVLLPIIILFILAVGMHLALIFLSNKRFMIKSYLGNVLLILLFTTIIIRSFVHSNIFTLYPNRYTSFLLGSINSVSLSIGGAATSYNFFKNPTPNKDDYVLTKITPRDNDNTPITIAVIMGESISPLRMSPFNTDKKTTPDIVKLAKDIGDDFVFSMKLGFANGVATIGSVPHFIAMTKKPQDVLGSGKTMLDLAKDAGFTTAYISAQKIKSLAIAGGDNGIDYLRTEQNMPSEVMRFRDQTLIREFKKLARQAPKKLFMFIHQRANHTNYVENCTPELKKQPFIKQMQAESINLQGMDFRRNQYDQGLYCYDNYLTGLIKEIIKRPGKIYIFVTSDHNELTGENGLWGHSMNKLEVALAPMMLITNHKDSSVVTKFQQSKYLKPFTMPQMIATALGYSLTTKTNYDGYFYINSTVPFAAAGFLKVRENDDASFSVSEFMYNGEKIRQNNVLLSDKFYDVIKGEN